MTANLTVPADVWACKRPGVPLVAAIVEGDHASDYSDRTNVVNPPAWLVALRDARCGNISTHRVSPGQCTDCHDGRLLHDVRVECETPICSGCHQPRTNWDSECRCSYTSFGIPPVQSYRTVRCLVDVVAIYDQSAWMPGDVTAAPTGDAIVVFDGHPMIWNEQAATYSDIPGVDALAAACGKPPADWVGGYAVILTEVGE